MTAKSEEEWRPVSGWDDYAISSMGRVRKRLGNGWMVIAQYDHEYGYKKVDLRANGLRTKFYVHRLVAGAFIPNHEGAPEVNHKDGDPSNNASSNLEWVTSSANKRHARDALGAIHGKPPRSVRVTDCVGVVTVFQSVSEAARSLGIRRPNLFSVLSGSRKSANGYTAAYVGDEND